MIRFICLNIFIFFHSLVFSLWAIILSLFDRNGKLGHFYCAVPWAKVVLWICGVKVDVKGLENVVSEIPRVYVTNHESYYTGDIEDACEALHCYGITPDEVRAVFQVEWKKRLEEAD